MTSRAARIRAFIKQWAVPFAVVWTLATLAALFVPGDQLPSTGLLEFDKLAHFVLFAGFAGLWMVALGDTLPKAWLYVIVLGVTYGVLTELAQEFVPGGRTGDPLDALADALGILAGTGAFVLWRRFNPPSDGATFDS
ncbi:MAG: VanZ family protein [Rhodothermales bacterium]|nr:VanZ family protein [Rhodothermales bacterium]MBO6778431.1 VanZ family protein [Rhodothermales bacterium]